MQSLTRLPLLKSINAVLEKMPQQEALISPFYSANAAYYEDNFLQEVKEYLQRYPETRHADIYLHDLHGHVRGKRISRQALLSLHKGCYFPLSVYAMDRAGQVINCGQSLPLLDEPDCLCLPVCGSLSPCAEDPSHNAQLLLCMKQADGTPCPHSHMSHQWNSTGRSCHDYQRVPIQT